MVTGMAGRILLTAMVMLLLLSVRALADDENEHSWSSLRQLSSGQRVVVVQKDARTRQGTFVSVSDESIVVREKESVVSVSRPDVLRVSAQGKHKRLRNALIGALVGGSVAGAAAQSGEAVFLGLWPGLAVGAVLPAHSRTVYRAGE